MAAVVHAIDVRRGGWEVESHRQLETVVEINELHLRGTRNRRHAIHEGRMADVDSGRLRMRFFHGLIESGWCAHLETNRNAAHRLGDESLSETNLVMVRVAGD